MKIHFIGIGGIGMSALAGISLKNGHEISGSDQENNRIIQDLRRLGAKINIGHQKENIPNNTNLVVITPAIPKNNPELKDAQKRKIKIKDRSEFLGKLMASKKAIAVAGTHGKTTISSMIAVILKEAKLDPTVAIGGIVPELDDRNWRNGKSEYMVVEACEYKSSFLALHPYISVIANIEEEHLDCFKDIDDIKNTFDKFLELTSHKGFAVMNNDDINTQDLIKKKHPFNVVRYGAEEGDSEWQVRNINELNGSTAFEVYKNNQKVEDFKLLVPGKHSVLNALAAIVTTAELGVSLGDIKEALGVFKGAERRMEVKGEKKNVLVVDDYGHHPTEIKMTLRALRDFYRDKKKMWCVFQPHQYSRTNKLFKDFLKSFDTPDVIIIPDIYKVRDSEEDIRSTSSEKLVNALVSKGINAIYISTFAKVAKYLKKNVAKNDLIVTMGAGPVNEVGELFLKNEDTKK